MQTVVWFFFASMYLLGLFFVGFLCVIFALFWFFVLSYIMALNLIFIFCFYGWERIIIISQTYRRLLAQYVSLFCYRDITVVVSGLRNMSQVWPFLFFLFMLLHLSLKDTGHNPKPNRCEHPVLYVDKQQCALSSCSDQLQSTLHSFV